MESYEKKQPVAFGGQYHFVAPVRLRRASSASRAVRAVARCGLSVRIERKSIVESSLENR